MENDNKLTIQNIQIAFFYKKNLINNSEYDKAQLLLDIQKELVLFDGSPVQIPTFDGMPANVNIPITILNSKDGLYTCNIALNRVDFLVKKMSVFDEKYFSDLKDKVSVIFNFFQKKSEINRVGFVFNCQYKNTEKVKFISDNFLKCDNFQEPKEIFLRYVSEDKSDKILMNHLITLSGDKKNDFIQVQLDINTAPENISTLIIETTDLNTLYSYIYDKIKKYIDNFPNLNCN